ncbi:hypothetical protein CH341_02410 [Rhodoplanes roseus]|uniref:Uncharacterized protein n=2 Tax=Rhodoplanes roseus TaxID=29409 RepID=A0A327L614_9BRAD|nr:hypothetical protein CH341_02410 [Rhodoplanes roseus]
MSMAMDEASEPHSDQEQKRAALGHIKEAWAEAWADGIDGDCLAQASLFCALTELVSTYGEEATARFAEGLPKRISSGEFSIVMSRQ